MHRPIRVLIVDDHATIREVISEWLAMENDLQVVGHGVNGDDAVFLADRLQPDVVILDLRMPGKSGMEALVEIQERQPEVRVIIYTSFIDAETTRKALRAGAVACLIKTEAPEKLVATIHHACQEDPPVHAEDYRGAQAAIWPSSPTSCQASMSLAA